MVILKNVFPIVTLTLIFGFQVYCDLNFGPYPHQQQHGHHYHDFQPGKIDHSVHLHHDSIEPNALDDSAQRPLVRTNWALIQGVKQQVLGRSVKTFLGIPYAEPPLGKLRFGQPVPLNGTYPGIYPATRFRSACMQRPGDEKIENLGGVGFNEDCLHLNIWVPDHNRPATLPVLFYLYSSAFYKSSPARPSNHGNVLAALGDIVVVAPNYRLGFLGFAFGDNDEMPGNMALYDALLALEWTRDNIHHFGGDPTRITLAGSSAGAIFSSLMSLSPLVAPSYFDQVFLMSGVAANGLYIESKNISLAKTRYIAEKVGCSQDATSTSPLTSDEVDCLRSANATDIVGIQEDDGVRALGASVLNGLMPIFGDAFMPEAPELLLAKGHYRDHMSFVVGNELEEDGISKEFWPENKTDAYQYLQDKFKKMIKDFEKIEDEYNKTINEYFDRVPEANRKLVKQAVVEILSDYTFNCPCLYFAEKLAQKSNIVHLYLNEYVASTFIRPGNMSQRPFGPSHGDDTLLFLGQPFREVFDYNHFDRIVSARLIHFFADYIKGKRVPWPPVLTHGTRVKPLRWRLTGEVDFKLIDVDPKTDVCKIWNQLRNRNEP